MIKSQNQNLGIFLKQLGMSQWKVLWKNNPLRRQLLLEDVRLVHLIMKDYP